MTQAKDSPGRSEREQSPQKVSPKASTFADLAHAIGHDLSAPVRHVDGFVERLLLSVGEEATEDQRRYAGYIEGGIVRMNDMIAALRDLCRIAADETLHGACSLEAAVTTARTEMSRRHPNRKIALQLAEPLPTVRGNAAQIERLFSEFFDNALRYSPEGRSTRICLSWEPNAGMMDFHFCDDGPGIPQGQRAASFKPLRKTPADGEGKGMGLAIARLIVERHGGKIALGGPGEWPTGLSVYFSLPGFDPALHSLDVDSA